MSKFPSFANDLRITEPNGEMVPRLAASGVASIEPTTIPRMFKDAATAHPDMPALKWENESQTEWKAYTWQEYYDESCTAARALIALGFEMFDTVNIIGVNSTGWFLAEMGAICAGGKAAGVYTTNETAACQYIAEHSKARVIFVENEKQLAKYKPILDELPALKAVVVWTWDAVPSGQSAGSKVKLLSWADFIALAADVPMKVVDERCAALRPGHAVTLIYTSGTTGNPKAVMVSHDNIIFEVYSAFSAIVFGEDFEATSTPAFVPDEMRVVSYLPLSHVAGQMLDMCGPIVTTAAGFSHGPPAWKRHYYTTWFARPDALKGSLKFTLAACHPTVFLGVPRVWEKLRDALMALGAQTTGFKKTLVTWAKAQCAKACAARQLNSSVSMSCLDVIKYKIARKLVIGKIHAALGLDQCIGAFTAAAPIPVDVQDYFGNLDISLLDLYGMSESTGGTTTNTMTEHMRGTTGKPFPGTELKIDHVADRDKPGEGEICYRGRHIMMGYMGEPAKTAEAIDKEGWLHSGDVGRLNEQGLLKITGRLKELIITAGGENIAPVPIEDTLKKLMPALSNAMLVGDKRKYNVVLLTLKTDLNLDTGESTGKLTAAAASVSAASTDAEAIAELKDKSSAWAKYLQGGIDEYNKKHVVSNAQKIQKFAVLRGDFSEKGGELTATLKLKRAKAAEKWAATIDTLY